ncbi:MAG: TonB-dependent receptor [Bryobacterales bacterium]|nr:TonB-dependent receptor [Bryobacterales bacterium]
MHGTTIRRLCAFAAVGWLFAQAALAQTGQLQGTVTDSTGAVIPGAEATLQNVATGIAMETLTNEAGLYTFPLLQSGSYELNILSAGFKPVTQGGIVMETSTVRTVDVQLELGDVTETVTVEAAAPLLQAETSTVGQLIERTTVMNMPVESRRAASLVRLTGTVVFRNEGAGGEQLPFFSMAGGRSRNQMWQLDGTSVQNSTIGIAQLGLNPTSESLQEFKVEINNLSAEYGRTGGGFILMTTRSGTNEFHGAAYEFLRNDALDARTFFAAGKAPLRYNIFGVSIGGPVRKDKTFFFFNWEGARRRTGRTFSSDDIPHPPEVQGDFSNRVDTAILDPLTGEPFPNHMIPQARMDPLGREFAGFYPKPNRTGNDITRRPRDNYLFNVSNPLDQNVYTTRVDHYFGPSDRIFGRYTASPNVAVNLPRFPVEVADPNAANINNDHDQVTIAWVHNFSPALINDFRYNWGNRQHINRSFGWQSGKNGDLGVQGVDPSFLASVFPAGLTRIGAGNHERVVPIVKTIQAINNLTWIKDSHQIKLGFNFRYSKFRDEHNQRAGGFFNFNDRATGDGLASLLLGWTTGATLLDNDPIHPRTDYVAGFVQDDWKVAPNLTLNLGLRWSMDSPRWEQDNQQSGFDIKPTNPVSGTPGIVTFAGRDGYDKYSHDFDRNNLGPRFGFAYRPRDDLVVRGGYGVVYYPIYISQVATRFSAGFSKLASFSSPDGGFTPAFRFQDGLPPPPPGAALDHSFGAVPLGSRPRFSPEFLQDNHSNGYSHQWNLTVQKQLRGNSVFEISYLGNVGHQLSSNILNINMIPLANGRGPERQDQSLRPYPQFNNVNLVYPDFGNSSYHALNTKLEKRYSGGLSYLMNYTWSVFKDDVEAATELAGGAGNGYQHIELRHLDKAYSGNHTPHRFITSIVYDLPLGKGRAVEIGNAVLNQIIGGWGVGTITELRSGIPYGIIERTNRSNTFSHSQRPNLVGEPKLPGGRSRSEFLGEFFDTSAFESPGVGVFGDSPRTLCCGPGFLGLDISAHKWFDFTERVRMQFRTDLFNIINRPNFRNPGTVHGRGDFGRIGGILVGSTGRQIQFSLRVEF